MLPSVGIMDSHPKLKFAPSWVRLAAHLFIIGAIVAHKLSIDTAVIGRNAAMPNCDCAEMTGLWHDAS